MSPLELIAVLVSILAVALTAARRIWCWPVGIVSVILYGWIFFQQHLYSDALLQIVFGAMQLYGWWHWRSGTSDHALIAPLALPFRGACIGIAAGIAGGFLLGSFMGYTDAAFPYLDAMLASFSLVAQWWQARRFMANWTLWILVDIVYVGMYWYKNLLLTAGLYGGFIVLAIIAAIAWRREYRKEHHLQESA